MNRKISSLVLVALLTLLFSGAAAAMVSGASPQRSSGPADLTPTDVIVVDSTGDEGGLSERCDTHTPCTLRRAINQARYYSSASKVFQIRFNLAASGPGYDDVNQVWIIDVNSDNSGSETHAFREFGTSGRVIIDGTTQPIGRDLSIGPRIILRGDNRKGAFNLTGGSNVIRGLALQGFANNMITVPGTSNNLVENNWFGLTTDGSDIYLRNLAFPQDGSGETGIYVQSGGVSNTVQNNILAGFKAGAIRLDSDNSFVLSNTVGTRADGTVPYVRPERHCQPNARYYNWFAGAGIDIGGRNNLIENNRLVGMLFQSNDPLNTPDDAISVSGRNHVVRRNIIGLTTDNVPFGVCGEGIHVGGAYGGHSIQVITNTIVGARGEAGILAAGGQFGYDLNQITVRGNVVELSAYEVFTFSKMLPATLRNFKPAAVTSIDGVNVSGTAGANSPCADCTIELFLDRIDMVTETLESLRIVQAGANGEWTAALPRPLAITEGLRTATTTAHDGQIVHPSGVYSAGMTTRLSELYTQTGAPAPVPPAPPAPLPPLTITHVSYMPPPTPPVTFNTVITVDSAEDPDDRADYTCSRDLAGPPVPAPDGKCTLRRAIVEATALMAETPAARPVQIRFNIPAGAPGHDAGLGVWVIQITDTLDLNALPTLGSTDVNKSGQVVIDGGTQPGGRSSGPKIIVRSAANREIAGYALVVNGANNVVRGLAWQKFRMALQFNHGGNIIEDNWFGLSADGQSIYIKNEAAPEDGSGQSGVTLASNASNNLVRNNRLAGFRGAALNVESDDSYIISNTVGARADGTVPEAPLSRWCKPNARYYNWFGGAGIEVGGKRNQVKDNIIAGLLWYSADPENTPDTALEIKGQDHLVQNNRIGVDAADNEVGTCGRGLVVSARYTNILSNTIVRTRLEPFRVDGTVVEMNALYHQGNVIRDSAWPNLVQFGDTVPVARAIFTPAQIITLTSLTAAGGSGEDAPCPYCRVELFLDDLDPYSDTLESLAVTYADANGKWSAALPRALAMSEGIRTASTALNYGVMPEFDYPSTSRFSLVYSQTGAVPPPPPPVPTPQPPLPIPDPTYAPVPTLPVAYNTVITVTTTDDTATTQTCADTTPDNCSLRRAINQVKNLTPAQRPVKIAFNIPVDAPGYNAAGFWKITLSATALPPVKGGQVTLDGSTQPDGRADGPKLILWRNSQAGAKLALGETQYEGSNIVRGLAFQGVKISMTGNGNIIEDNWLGLSDDGAGIYFYNNDPYYENHAIVDGAGNSGNHLIRNNRFAGSRTNSINLSGNDNVVQVNLIGLVADGTIPLTPPAGTLCNQTQATDNWFGGGGVYISGRRNRVISNTIAGLLIRGSATTTPPDAIALPSGQDNLVQYNVIGRDAHGAAAWTCGSGLDIGSSFNRVLSNTIVNSYREGIFVNGAAVAINANMMRGNVISDCAKAVEFGDAVPAELKMFNPALVTAISGNQVSGISDSACPYCWVDVYLDDEDNVVEALAYLGSAIANVYGDWSLSLPAALSPGQGLRTISTARDYGAIKNFEAGTSSRLSILFKEQPPTAPASVSITPPAGSLGVGVDYVFSASVTPVTATLPITYTWQATGQPTRTERGGTQNSVTFRWDTPGAKHITVTVNNGIGSPVSAYLSVQVGGGGVSHKIFLPLVLKNQ